MESIKRELLRLFQEKLIDVITIKIIWDYLVKINEDCLIGLSEETSLHLIGIEDGNTEKGVLERYGPIFLVHIGNYQFRITDMQRSDAIQIYDALSHVVHIRPEED
jgi:hypothetical protein